MGRSGVTFMKRKKGLKKKTFELATLCDIEACMVSFGPNGELDTWPENSNEAKAILKRYKDLSKEEQEKRNLGLSNYLEEKKEKLEEELNRRRKENSSLAYPAWDDRLDELSNESLRELGNLLQSKLVKIRERVEYLVKVNNQSNVKGKGIENFEMVREFHQPSLPLVPITEKLDNPVMFESHSQPVLPLRTILPAPLLPQWLQGLVFQPQTYEVDDGFFNYCLQGYRV
ncbi:hypothetical protein HHK36_026350 [Tetracentron sinense]|uniref:MADS-box domain-containing protein n=1 Tax=Tetracentron sinense TaxID=13715 RepID=A0A834YL69_TETSI|nr:hypothetical protein HHK36_026350 [Tetracentron sinense]